MPNCATPSTNSPIAPTINNNNISTSYIEPVAIEPDYTEIMPNEEVIHEVHEIKEDHQPASLSLEQNEIEMIKRALEKYNGKRKDAAKELGISERTLYRKINEFGITA